MPGGTQMAGSPRLVLNQRYAGERVRPLSSTSLFHLDAAELYAKSRCLFNLDIHVFERCTLRRHPEMLNQVLVIGRVQFPGLQSHGYHFPVCKLKDLAYNRLHQAVLMHRVTSSSTRPTASLTASVT